MTSRISSHTPARVAGGSQQQRPAGRPQRFARKAEVQIGRPKVMTPLRDAVRFVHDKQADATGGLQLFDKLALLQPLRRAVDQLCDAAVDFLFRLPLRAQTQGRVHLLDRDIGLGCALLLVLHQRDQRAHHQHRLVQQQRGKLVGEGLAAAGRQQAQHVTAGEDRLQDLALPGPQSLDPETACVLPARFAPRKYRQACSSASRAVVPCDRSAWPGCFLSSVFPAWLGLLRLLPYSFASRCWSAVRRLS